MKQPIVVLGAGIYQMGLIQKSQKLGYYVHVLSRAGNYPGIKIADEFHEIDTTDRYGVLEFCQRIKPKFVVTSGSDVCMPAIGMVNEVLGLPGVKSAAAETMSTKTRFREFESKHGLECPVFFTSREVEDAWERFRACNSDMLLKPSMASGSRGISRVAQGIHKDEFVRLYEVASKNSLSREVCCEAFLPGKEIGGNAILKNGKCAFIAISRKHLDGFIVTGHEYPSDLSNAQRQNVIDVLENCVNKLAYSDGPLNFDMMIDGSSARIIEPCARFGGNGLVVLCKRAFGVDLEMNMLRSFSGLELDLQSTAPRHCGSYVFGSDRTGVLTGMASVDELRRSCPWVISIETQRHIGDCVDKMKSNADLIGYVIFDILEGMTWDLCVSEVKNHLQLELA